MEPMYRTATYSIHELDGNIKYHNRVLKKEEGVYMSWPGTAAEFYGWFEGDIIFDLDITIHPYMDDGRIFPLYFFTDVDGVLTKVGPFDENTKQIVISGLMREYHHIRLIKMNQSQMSTVILKAITFTGEIDLKPAEKPMKIECIGDSITCGEALMYKHAPDFSEILFESSEIVHAYPTQLGKILDADVSHVSCGGWGVDCCEWNYGQTIPSIYDYTCWFDDKHEKWDHSSFEPDVIIVALGTNDSGHCVPEDKFKNGVKEFLDHLLEIHPDAYIIWAYGMMWNHYGEWLETAISDFADDRVKLYLFDKNNDGGYDHPSIEGHTRFAKTFARLIRAKFDI